MRGGEFECSVGGGAEGVTADVVSQDLFESDPHHPFPRGHMSLAMARAVLAKWLDYFEAFFHCVFLCNRKTVDVAHDEPRIVSLFFRSVKRDSVQRLCGRGWAEAEAGPES